MCTIMLLHQMPELRLQMSSATPHQNYGPHNWMWHSQFTRLVRSRASILEQSLSGMWSLPRDFTRLDTGYVKYTIKSAPGNARRRRAWHSASSTECLTRPLPNHAKSPESGSPPEVIIQKYHFRWGRRLLSRSKRIKGLLLPATKCPENACI